MRKEQKITGKKIKVTTQLAISYSKLTIETLEQSLKYIWTYFTPCSSVSIINFEQENAAWQATSIK